MKNYLILTCALLFIGISGFAQNSYYIQCARLIDVESMKLQENMTVIVRDARIEGVATGYLTPQPGDSAELILLHDHTLMPGLIDMHVHMEGQSSPDRYIKAFSQNDVERTLEAIPYSEITLLAGFTTVRDLGGSGINLALRDAIEDGTLIGPRIFSAGKSIASTGGHADPTNGFKRELMSDAGPKEGVADGVSQCMEAVRWRYKDGSDCIKVTGTGGVLSVAKSGDAPQFTDEEFRAIVDVSADYGFHVAVHAHGAEGMKRAVIAGVHTIEHGTKMTDEVMDLMKANNCYLVPTITAGKSVENNAKKLGYYPEVVRVKALEIGPMIQNTFAKAYKRGVPIAFGTDAGVFNHGENWKEFVYMNEAGMPMMECIRSATLIPAKILNRSDEFGAIKPGLLADLVAVQGNPLNDPAQMEKVSFVMKEGVVYKQK